MRKGRCIAWCSVRARESAALPRLMRREAGAYLDGTPVLCFTHPDEIKELLHVEKYPKLQIAYDIIVTMLGDVRQCAHR